MAYFDQVFKEMSVGGQMMLLVLKLVNESQMNNTPKRAAKDISSKFSIPLPLRAQKDLYDLKLSLLRNADCMFINVSATF